MSEDDFEKRQHDARVQQYHDFFRDFVQRWGPTNPYMQAGFAADMARLLMLGQVITQRSMMDYMHQMRSTPQVIVAKRGAQEETG